MKRIVRDRRLTPEQAAKYNSVRMQVAAELPELISRHHERGAVREQLQSLLEQLKAAREAVNPALGGPLVYSDGHAVPFLPHR